MAKYYDDTAEVLWKDRKRFCGMPLSFTRYILLKKDGKWAKLINNNGFLSSVIEEINIYRIDDIGVFQSLSGKIFNTGNVEIYCNDASCNKLVLKNIKNPYKVRVLINNIISEERARLKVHQSEVQY